MPPPIWNIWVETGGTFTDCLALAPDGTPGHAKVLSSGRLRGVVTSCEGDSLVVRGGVEAAQGLLGGCELRSLGSSAALGEIRADERVPGGLLLRMTAPLSLGANSAVEIDFGEDAPIVAARLVTRTPRRGSLPPAAMRLATTRGTNSLLTRRGARVALFITSGFTDLLRIGDQTRPDIFALRIDRPEPLCERVVAVDGRLNFIGAEIEPLNLRAVRAAAKELVNKGITSAAVSLLHSTANQSHEAEVADVLRECGFTHVSCSARLSGLPGLLTRTRTAVVNAFLAPEIERYLAGVSGALGSGGVVQVMTSSGGLVRIPDFTPKDSLLSGPASGVVGAAAAAAESGCSPIITFDMGGTSTDVSRFERACDLVYEHTVGGARLSATAVAVESIAAGGGSICWLDRKFTGGLAVGPSSAGAHPGPACYGAGGPLTVTDCNLLLGRLDAGGFSIPIVREAAEAKADELLREVRDARRDAGLTRERLLEELLDIADESMAGAIRRISVQRGYDPRAHTLVAFGGAAGQHACGVADRLGITKVLVPRDVGLLSAAGLAAARIERHATHAMLSYLSGADGVLPAALREVTAHAVALARRDAEDVVVERRLVEMRLTGQDAALTIELPRIVVTPSEVLLRDAFRAKFELEYGYPPPQREIEVVSLRVVASGPRGQRPAWRAPEGGGDGSRREGMSKGSRVRGPALISEAHGATLVRAGWSAEVDGAGALVMTREAAPREGGREITEIVSGRLYAIATEMGEKLRRTALSTNIKERLDFSCAVLDSEGRLIVNAPHLPVHLGALGVTVRALKESLRLGEGDVGITNHPAFGGSHLPDITVVTPVFDSAGGLLAFVANRAHHAEIGGIRPGSMPPGAKSLAEEGVVIPPMHLVRAGVSCEAEVLALLRGAPFPSRLPEENMADLAAQVAANRRGAEAVAAMAVHDGGASLRSAMDRARARARERLLEALAPLKGRELTATEHLDDGAPIAVRIAVGERGATVDFAGSAGVHAGNFNAPLGVVRSAVMYTLRLLIAEPLPLNEGLMDAVDLRVPEGMLNPCFHADAGRCPAVCAGNVETSQRVVDTLVRALGIGACGQGTMNNVIFGNDRFGYYETVCGGAGAGPGFAGASAVHTHMTNTRITDPEVLERCYPVRLRSFSVLAGSGGEGAWRGGDGVRREYEFLEPVSLSLLAQHRGSGPFGGAGGGAGRPGRQAVILPGGRPGAVPGVAQLDLPGRAILVLETPGGGGWGQI